MMQLVQQAEQKQGLELKLILPLTARIGELELLSLHRIKNRWNSLDSPIPVKNGVMLNICQANEEYRKEKKHNRYCVTPYHVDSSIDGVCEDILEIVEIVTSKYNLSQRNAVRDELRSQAQGLVQPVKTWFADNYDELIYDTKGKIPWPVVVQMRTRFRLWARGELGVFDDPINEVLYEAARELNVDTNKFDSDEALWHHLRELSQKTTYQK